MARGGKGGGHSQLRIIGGQWRGRKLAFTPEEGLRPTADRVRETLFNWLAADIHGARCLDLFAGSGALGLEALSRGAAFCDFVESSSRACRQIQSHLALLDATERGHCSTTGAELFLRNAQQPYDIVFLDPPFGRDLLAPACAGLVTGGLLASGALVYIETGNSEALPDLPANWVQHRDKRAGAVSYRLFVVDAG